MLELSPARKNKINLADYNWQQDVENRILMSDFSALDVEVLEEILFNPLKISFRKLLRSLSCEEGDLAQSLQKFSQAGLVSIQDDTIAVDKEKRRVFEFQITRFNPAFKPDMEFIQGLLKKIPIQLLPTWYAIPRSSNNIFESIVEKYLLTPHIYQRYLQAFKKGVFNYIKEELPFVASQKIRQTIPRKYFSGGVFWAEIGDTSLSNLSSLKIINVCMAVHVSFNQSTALIGLK